MEKSDGNAGVDLANVLAHLREPESNPDDWGDVDESLVVSYVCGHCTEVERRTVEETLGRSESLRDAVDDLRNEWGLSSPSPNLDVVAPEPFKANKERTEKPSYRIPFGIAASLLIVAGGAAGWFAFSASQLQDKLVQTQAQLASGENGPRQYYTSWKLYPAGGYYYREFRFRPKPDSTEYTAHYVIYRPERSTHAYFYNPESKQYWGRLDYSDPANPRYSLLNGKDRRPRLAEIAEASFPESGAMPTLAATTDNLTLIPPRDGLPSKIDPDDLPEA